jgi:hypothetical protein
MNRTRLAAHVVSVFLSIAASIAVATALVFSQRTHGPGGATAVLVAASLGVGLGYLIARRRTRKRAPHRLVIRRGVWLLLVPSVVGTLLGSLIAAPSVLVWMIAALAGLGISTVIMMTERITGPASLGTAGLGIVLGLVAVFVLSQANLRQSVEQVGRANGVTIDELNQFPKTISLAEGNALGEDPRTGILAGSIREVRTQTIRAQFIGSLRYAALFSLLSLITSLVLPRNLFRKLGKNQTVIKDLV